MIQGRRFDPDAIFVAMAGGHQFKTLGSVAPRGQEAFRRTFPVAGEAFTEVSKEARVVQRVVETVGKFVTSGAKSRVQS